MCVKAFGLYIYVTNVLIKAEGPLGKFSEKPTAGRQESTWQC